MNRDISGVILAGGENRRFGGKSKTEIIIGGRTILSRVIETIRDIFDETIIVTNNPEKFSGSDGCKITSDIFIKRGPAGGLHAAMKVSSKPAVFVFAGDMPFLEKKLIARQIKLFTDNKCDALVPGTGNNIEPLHSIYRTSFIYRLEKYLSETDNPSIHGFISQMDVYFMNIDTSGKAVRSFININSPSDLNKIKNNPDFKF
jgi:molybdopterin-guanine dinucleotide biosynthesis protein A